MNLSIRATAAILVCMATLIVYSQRASSKRKPSSKLYQVTLRDKQSGQRKFGFIDRTGKLVIDYDRLPKNTLAVGEFHEGRALVYVQPPSDGVSNDSMRYRVGYIDTAGEMLIPPNFDHASDFSEGLASAVNASDRFLGFIDRWGKPVIKLVGTTAQSFHEGLAVAARANQKGFGYIDRTGRMVIDKHYRFADEFSEGRAGVVIDGKYGFIDRKGNLVIPARFDVRFSYRHPEVPVSSGRFREGLACVSLQGSFGYIDKHGDFVIPPQFIQAEDFSEGLAWVLTKDRTKAGWIDKSGKWIVTGIKDEKFSIDFVRQGNSGEVREREYSEGLVPFVITKDDQTLWGYLSLTGEIAIQPLQFSEAGLFVGGVARVSFFEKSESRPEKTAGYVDPKGQFMEEKYGYIDRTGRFIWRSQ